MLFSIRASRWRRGGFERWDVSHWYDGGRRLSAGLQTEATQSVSAQKHIRSIFVTTHEPRPNRTEEARYCVVLLLSTTYKYKYTYTTHTYVDTDTDVAHIKSPLKRLRCCGIESPVKH